MIKTFSFVFWTVVSIYGFAQQTFIWADKIGSTGTDIGASIAVDGAGNVYTTGRFQGTVDFDPGAGVSNLITAPGGYDIFVSKLDASGNFLWAKQLGDTTAASWDFGIGIALDGSGNVYTTGYFGLTADFDPGPGTYTMTSSGPRDIFVSKLDPLGNFVWAKQLGGIGDDRGRFVAVDAIGDVYTTGFFEGTADFDPGSSAYNLTSVGQQDIFVSKLNASGNFIWAKRFGGGGVKGVGGVSSDQGASIAFDPLGNVYITGFFINTGDFDPGAGFFNLTSAGGSDVFVSKLDALGNFIWAKRLGGTGGDSGSSIASDAGGNVFITGSFNLTVDFDPGAGTFNLTSAGAGDIFINKLDGAGIFIFAKQMGGGNVDFASAIALDGIGNIYTTGTFGGTADFDPGTGTSNLISAGFQDIFISKLDATGNFICVGQMGGTLDDRSSISIGLDGAGNIHTTGWFEGTADFDPMASTYNLASAGGSDIFISKLGGCVSALSVVTAQANVLCNGQCAGSATANANGGTPTYTYSWNTVPVQTTITATGLCIGIYTVTVYDASGTTSTATFSITAPPLLTAALTSTANVLCKGQCTGSSVVTPAGGTPGYTYFWNSAAPQSTSNATGLCAGNYTCTITDANGCDTLQTVAIAEPPAVTAAVTPTATTCGKSNGSANVNAGGGTPGYTYIWPASGGQTTSTATGLGAGNYNVIVSDANNCTQTASITIAPSAGPNVSLTAQSNVLCNGDNDGTAAVAAAGGSPPYTYLWNPTAVATAAATGLSAAIYTITVTDAIGCTQNQTVTITEPAILTAGTATTPDTCSANKGTATANPGGGTPAYTYAWSLPAGQAGNGQVSPTAIGLKKGTYTITITDANNCSNSTTVTVTDIPCPCPSNLDLTVPNAFSPNGDGQNDEFCLQGGANLEDCIRDVHITIFDRWGEKVYESTEKNFCWDGTYGLTPRNKKSTKLMNSAVFVYYMDAILTSGKQIITKGNISLIR